MNPNEGQQRSRQPFFEKWDFVYLVAYISSIAVASFVLIRAHKDDYRFSIFYSPPKMTLQESFDNPFPNHGPWYQESQIADWAGLLVFPALLMASWAMATLILTLVSRGRERTRWAIHLVCSWLGAIALLLAVFQWIIAID